MPNIRGDSYISTSTFDQGNAGAVSVNVDNTLTIDDATSVGVAGRLADEYGGISSAEFGMYNSHAGNVSVHAGSLELLNGGWISTDVKGLGVAGAVSVNADRASILGGSYISSKAWAESSGITGDVSVTLSEWLHMAGRGLISIENRAQVSEAFAAAIQPGNIAVIAPDITMQDSSSISSSSQGYVSAGGIVLNFSHWLTMDLSSITATAQHGNGGSVVINGGESMFLQGSKISTIVSGTDKPGGNISISADRLVMDTGLIMANAYSGFGGNVLVNSPLLLPSNNTLLLGAAPVDTWQAFVSGFNAIQASGKLSVTPPQLNLSGVLATMSSPQFDSSLISQDFCGLGAGSTLTRLGNGGLPLKARDLPWY